MKIIQKSIEVGIGQLENWKHNAREIHKSDFERLKEQITDLGIYKPMVCYEEAGKYIVLGGNMRLRAIKELGYEKGWITVVLPDNEEEKIKINLSDNDRAGFYDDEAFAEVIYPFKDNEIWSNYKLDFNIPDKTVDDFAREQFEEEETAGNTDDDAVPGLPDEAKTKLGELWVLGDHRVLCGDATKREDVGQLMNGQLIDLLFSDPPYGVLIGDKNKMLDEMEYNSRKSTSKETGRIITNIKNDTMSVEDLKDMLTTAFLNIKNASNDKCSYYVTAPQGGDLGMMMMMMKDAGLPVRHVIIWVKNRQCFSMGRLDYEYKHEPILYTWNKSHEFHGKGKHLNSVWEVDKVQKCDIHPTMKPVDLIINAIKNSSLEGNSVADTFLGSGSTLIACEKTNRKCYGMELDPLYIDVILQRWADFTGEDPVREDGVKWSDITTLT